MLSFFLLLTFIQMESHSICVSHFPPTNMMFLRFFTLIHTAIGLHFCFCEINFLSYEHVTFYVSILLLTLGLFLGFCYYKVTMAS